MKTSRVRSWVGASLCAALALSACSSDDAAGGGSTTAGSNSPRPVITISTYDSFVLDPDVEAAIEAKLGVDLEVSAAGDGAEALAAAILTAGRPEGDIFFGVDNMLLTRALAEPVFSAFDPSLVPNLDLVPSELRLDDSGRLVPIDVGPVCIDYDMNYFAERSLAVPSTLEELAEPQYASLLVVPSPVTSTPGLAFLLATGATFGDDAPAFWQDLIDGGARVVGGWSEAWYEEYSVSGGEYPLVVSYASSPPAEVFYSEGEVTEPSSGIIESTCVEQVEFAGVLEGTPEPELAAKVLNEMLDLTYQESLPLANFVYPARTDAALPELFTSFAPRPSAPITLDAATIDENRDRWIDTWRTIAG